MSKTGSEGKGGPQLRRVPLEEIVGATAWASRRRGAVTWRALDSAAEVKPTHELAACVEGEWVMAVRPKGGPRDHTSRSAPETLAFRALVAELRGMLGRAVTAAEARAEARARGLALPSKVAVSRSIDSQNKAIQQS